MKLFNSSSTINFRNPKCPTMLPQLGSQALSFNPSFLRFWQPPWHCNNNSKKKANGADCSALLCGTLSWQEGRRRQAHDGEESLLLASRQHSLSSKGSVTERPHQAQPSPALLKQDFICRGPCHSQVVWEEFHFQNEVQMLFSKSIF